MLSRALSDSCSLKPDPSLHFYGFFSPTTEWNW